MNNDISKSLLSMFTNMLFWMALMTIVITLTFVGCGYVIASLFDWSLLESTALCISAMFVAILGSDKLGRYVTRRCKINNHIDTLTD